MQISLSEAIRQLREELRKAVLDGMDEDILFTPNAIEIELSVSFSAEAKAGAGVKMMTFIDLSAEAKTAQQSQHKIKLSLSVTDKNGKPIKVMRSNGVPTDLLK